jgi:uncharacterized membrane protein
MKNVSTDIKNKHEKMLWTVFACLFLGVSLIFAQFAFGYTTKGVIYSDIIAGLVVVIASIFAIKPNRVGFFCLWVICLVGLYLNFAPLLFWAKESIEYMVDTTAGILLVIFSLIIPGLPGKVEETGHQIPAGWSYNPSSWPQRLPVIKLAIAAMFISRYLASFQLGYIQNVWDPLFDGGSVKVLLSNVADFFPVSDAGLGCFVYTIEVLLGLKGGSSRWRTMPWMVVGFVMLVVPAGIVSIILVLLQPFVVGAWCFFCLLTALAMLFMIVFAIDELVAVFQFLYQSKKANKGLLKTFFHGGDLPFTKDEEEIKLSEAPFLKIGKNALQGLGFTWNLLLCSLIGIFLMLSPYLFSLDGRIKDIDHFVGSLVVVISILSFAEVIRAARFINMLFGAFLIVTSFLYSTNYLALLHIILATLLIFLSIFKGKIKEQYGSFEKFIK